MDLVTASGQLITARRAYACASDNAEYDEQLSQAFAGLIEAFEQVTQRRGTLTFDQQGCARCGAREHPSLSYYPLDRQVVLGDGETWTHWALCPRSGEPIMLNVIHDKEEAT